MLASDAFFPFADGVEEAAKHGITAVIQPGGSVRDDDVIAAADRLGLAMVSGHSGISDTRSSEACATTWSRCRISSGAGPQQLILLLVLHLELIQSAAQVLHQRVEIGTGDSPCRRARPSYSCRYTARSAAGLADLVDKVYLEFLHSSRIAGRLREVGLPR